MLCLPAIGNTNDRPVLAVADASIAALEAALLDPESAVEVLRDALLVDPWLCRWAAASCPQATTIAQLAEQLAGCLSERLEPLAAQPDTFTRPPVSEAQTRGAQAESIRDQAQAVDLGGHPAADSVEYCAAMRTAPPDETSTLVVSDYLEELPGIQWRLPRLVQRLRATTVCPDALRAAKLDAMKELAYGASHEINNPLANISGRAQTLLRDEDDPLRRKLLKAIDHQALRAHEMISDLMLFARPPALNMQAVEPGELIAQAIAELDELARERQIELKRATTAQLVVSADPTQLLVALKALIENSIEAVGQAGSVALELRSTGNDAEIRVVDTGPGISEQVQQHMFDPFFSGREAGRGLGFGLSKCWRIVDLHGGCLELERTSNAGTTFVVRLPLAVAEQ